MGKPPSSQERRRLFPSICSELSATRYPSLGTEEFRLGSFSLSRPRALNHLPQKTSRRTENMSWLRQKLRPVCKPTAHEMVTIFWPRNRSLFYNRYKKNVPFSSPQTGTVFLLLFHKAASFFFTVGIAGFPPGNRCLEAVERRGARSPRGRQATASHQPRRDSGSFSPSSASRHADEAKGQAPSWPQTTEAQGGAERGAEETTCWLHARRTDLRKCELAATFASSPSRQ